MACLWRAQLPTCPFEARYVRSGTAPVPDPGGPARLSSWILSVLPGSRLAQAVLRGLLLPVVLVLFSVHGSWSCSRAGPAGYVRMISTVMCVLPWFRPEPASLFSASLCLASCRSFLTCSVSGVCCRLGHCEVSAVGHRSDGESFRKEFQTTDRLISYRQTLQNKLKNWDLNCGSPQSTSRVRSNRSSTGVFRRLGRKQKVGDPNILLTKMYEVRSAQVKTDADSHVL